MDVNCPYCSVGMDYLGRLPFRVGGASGGMGMLLGSWNQLSERTETFDLYKCGKCGKVDFFLPVEGSPQQGSQASANTVSPEDAEGEHKKHHLFG